MPRPAARVLTLLDLLQSGGTRTVAELADRLGVDGRTVRRYVDQLIELDVPVESVRGRYGGYRLGPGYRVPPLMFGDEEALAVLLGLVAGRRAGLTTAQRTANETAAAKIRRVLPRHLAGRLDTLLESLSFTEEPGEFASPDADVLLTLADAVRHRRPVSVRYTDREGRRSDRTLHPYGIVAHAGRWYVTGRDADREEDRTLRLDRIADARTLPGSFEVPEGTDPAARVVTGFATAAYRYEVTLRVRATPEHIRAHLPPTVATLEELEPEWQRVGVHAESLDWLPPVLAALDRPFVIEAPAELRTLMSEFAARLTAYAHRTGSTIATAPEPGT
ncbi:helix-turn-helix transcriptional regulator [Streptomyces althioticus]|uniref:helix-turn-helix transcriptional regulator n=1 Tax=Streptomyces althioticus TaxID=83380 RepID=UPI0036802EFD